MSRRASTSRCSPVAGTYQATSTARGLTTPDQSEALVKRAMVGAARRRVLVSDATKTGDDHLHRFADLADLDLIITDTGLDADVAAEIRTLGPEVVLT